jgi:hypothetical protein
VRRERRAGGEESEDRSVHRRTAVMTWPREKDGREGAARGGGVRRRRPAGDAAPCVSVSEVPDA